MILPMRASIILVVRFVMKRTQIIPPNKTQHKMIEERKHKLLFQKFKIFNCIFKSRLTYRQYYKISVFFSHKNTLMNFILFYVILSSFFLYRNPMVIKWYPCLTSLRNKHKKNLYSRTPQLFFIIVIS